jgi:uncharacterized protein DUF1569
MLTLWQPEARARIRRRLDVLRPDSAPRWGRFTAPQMLAHLTESLRMSMGERPVAARPVPAFFRHAPFKQFAVYLMPFPKGLPTAPELLARPLGIAPAQWTAERAAFDAALERFAARAPDSTWPAHPAFGSLGARAWGTLQYRHVDHHCRQFGA